MQFGQKVFHMQEKVGKITIYIKFAQDYDISEENVDISMLKLTKCGYNYIKTNR